jgi:hypothetical protein
MRLYTYTSTKEGLLDLMIDELYGELEALGPLRGDFRAVLRTYAKRLRVVATKHRWFVSLLGGRPHPGPNALASFERLLTALLRSIPKLEEAISAGRVVNNWAVGALLVEANDWAAERTTGLDERGFHEAVWPWLSEQLSTGQFPNFARVVHEVEHDSPDAIFEHGLECVLHGVAAQLSGRPRK